MKITPGTQSLILAGEPTPPRTPAPFAQDGAAALISSGPKFRRLPVVAEQPDTITALAARPVMRVSSQKLVSQEPIDVTATDADSESWQSAGFEIQQYLSTRGSGGDAPKGANLDVRA